MALAKVKTAVTDVSIESAKRQLEEAISQGICPIPLKLKLMRHYWNLATNADGDIISVVHAELAAEQAAEIAPYVHPKIASLDISGSRENPLRFLFAPEDESL